MQVYFILVITFFISFNAPTLIYSLKYGDACNTDSDCNNLYLACNNDQECGCSLSYLVPSLDLTTCSLSGGQQCTSISTSTDSDDDATGSSNPALECTDNSSCVDIDNDGVATCTCDVGYVLVQGDRCDNDGSTISDSTNYVCCSRWSGNN